MCNNSENQRTYYNCTVFIPTFGTLEVFIVGCYIVKINLSIKLLRTSM